MFDNKNERRQKFLKQYEWFIQYLKASTPDTFSKIIMTGVLCLRHVGIFSGNNSFTNFSMNPKYKTTFGFTKSELLGNNDVKSALITILKKHQFISENHLDPDQEFNEFLNEIFKNYNGFHFTEDLSEDSSVISPISFIKHIETMNDFPCDPKIPLSFSNYWAKTGQTKIIKALLPDNMNPYKLPKILYGANFSTINLKEIDNVHDYLEPETIPLNVLLFHTGYFSISRKINSKIEFTWTNIETKQAFFETYNRDLKFNDKFLVSFCENLSKFALEDESEKQEIERFFENLQKFFLDIHQRYYQPEEIDHEHNFVFWFFFDVLTSIIDQYSEIQILLRWKLTNLEDDLRKGGEPDIIIFDKILKIALIIEFQKTSNK